MSVWGQKSGQLATSSDRDFERLVLPLLHACWPNLVQPPPRKKLDNYGIDLVEWDDSLTFPCVVQCKGLYAHELLIRDQLPQIRHSIAAFLESPCRCEEYVLVHNRTGEESDAREAIAAELKKLVEVGKAQRVYLWDRQKLLQRTEKCLKKMIEDRVARRAADRLHQQRSYFLFGDVFVEDVPAQLVTWRFTTLENFEVAEVAPGHFDLPTLIGSVKNRKWTLLVGHFGVGKSTMALQSSSAVGSGLVYVRADELPNEAGSVGTNYLMQNILRSLELFKDLKPESAVELERLAGTLLRKILCNPEKNLVLIIDALDESPTYASAPGLVQLTNELEELRSPVVLVTRKEHFDSTYGNFETVMEHLTRKDLSTKRGKTRDATILELLAWTPVEVVRFLEQCLARCDEDERPGVANLLEAARSGQLAKLFKELHAHPLFLQMLVEVTAEDGEIPGNSALLIWKWTKQKIKRDLRSGRATPWGVEDTGVFVDEMMRLMAEVAAATLRKEEGRPILSESLPDNVVLDLVPEHYRSTANISTIAATSLLVPASKRSTAGTPIRFYHRVLQEFYLAVYVKTNGLDHPLPDEVRFWLHELENVEL